MFRKLAPSLLAILLFFPSCSDEILPPDNEVTDGGVIKGIVRKANTQIPVVNATIKIEPLGATLYTNSEGMFKTRTIKAGNYNIYATCEGLDMDSINVLVRANDTISVGFKLYASKEYLEYYPLSVGNYWEYHFIDGGKHHSLEVISDTIINGKRYFTIFQKFFNNPSLNDFIFERIDAALGVVYRYDQYFLVERPIDSLTAQITQTFSSNMLYNMDRTCQSYCYNIEQKFVFVEVRKIKYFRHICGTDLPEYHLIKGIGFGGASVPRGFLPYKLKYARIKGVEYWE